MGWCGVHYESSAECDGVGYIIRAVPVLPFRLSPALPPGDLSFKLLQLIPTKRLLANDALHHAYFSSLPPEVYTISDGMGTHMLNVHVDMHVHVM